ncbi:MAG: alanine--tRNA ligase [Candidatus Aureabacteria bacterium]|nr:alanine--tRNA ligase [Candidatus Auribacterota bacterium]
MKPVEIRKKYLDFFQSKGHSVVESDSLIPSKDPTLLFTTAGMVQFKPLYAGAPLPYSRAVTVQKCLRAGGKGSDLEKVGQTLRHHTFFEMLGNFSFGDYFKKEAILFAWEFITQILRMDTDKLWVSVFNEDEEARALWIKAGFNPDRIVKLGKEDNFWGPAGDEGACGPCSEIYFDLGPEHSCGNKNCQVGCSCERHLEFWNLVFPQFYQEKDGSRRPLARKGVDTGMGLERLSFLMDPTAENNYQTALFKPIISKIEKIASQPYEKEVYSPYHVIADHIRTLVFSISDGILPSNEGRGYVIRRILRRALRYGRKLGLEKPFLHSLAPMVNDIMSCQYPELMKSLPTVKEVIKTEEEKFTLTLNRGLEHLEEAVRERKGKEYMEGETVFKLYDTWGLPYEIIEETAQEYSLKVDQAGFEKAMLEQKRKGKQSWKGTSYKLDHAEILLDGLAQTEFFGYEKLKTQARVLALIAEEKRVDKINDGIDAILVCDKSVFYAEAGGQAADTGVIKWENGEAHVGDVQKSKNNVILHSVQILKGTLQTDSEVILEVDAVKRRETQKNHTATHLLQYVLRKRLGDHVKQAGSYVNAEKLRFDFSHSEKIPFSVLKEIESEVNELIFSDASTVVDTMPLIAAKSRKDIIANFGEKYGEEVRLVSVGDFSRELCGGTHISHIGLIGGFKILSESSVSAGIRRIEAITGQNLMRHLIEHSEQLQNLASFLKIPVESVMEKVEVLTGKVKELEKKLAQASSAGSRETKPAEDFSYAHEKTQIIIEGFKGLTPEDLMRRTDGLKSSYPQLLACLGSITEGQIHFLAVRQGIEKVDCGKLMRIVTAVAEGKGGGRPDMARGGGKNTAQLRASLKEAEKWIREQLSL